MVVGAGTLRSDDPELTARDGNGGEHQPRPVILAGAEPLPGEARIWGRDPWSYPPGRSTSLRGTWLWSAVTAITRIRSRRHRRSAAGLLDLLLEGGPRVAAAWWNAGLVTRGVLDLAGKSVVESESVRWRASSRRSVRPER